MSTALFDLDNIVEPFNGPGPRARRTDPDTSHVAADATQAHLHEAKQRVLRVVAVHGPLVGSEINDQYRVMASHHNWRRLAYDSPRKRAGELVADGFLRISGTRIAEGNSLPESIYAITDLGREAIA